VFGAEMIFIPRFWISTIAAPTNISLELNSMSFMITAFKTVFAYDTSGILLAVEAAPRYIAK